MLFFNKLKKKIIERVTDPVKYTAVDKITVENNLATLNNELKRRKIPIDSIININETQYYLMVFYKIKE